MTTKTCSRCKRELDVVQFHRDRSRHDGLEHHCKECKARMAKDRYERKRDEILAQQRASRRDSYSRRGEEIRRQSRERYARDPEKHRARKRASYDPAKAAARNAVCEAIHKGTLERQPCQVCGTTDRIEAHHDSYAEDRRLDVRWLCARHHRQHHADNEEQDQ